MSQARAVPVGHAEPHDRGMATRLNWLRAAVLRANDGSCPRPAWWSGWPGPPRPAGLARHVAERLTARDALTAHTQAELGIDTEQLVHPGHTAGASLLSLMAGAVLPLLAITLVPGPARIAVTIIAVLAALVAAGAASAAPGRAPPPGCRAQRDRRHDRHGRDIRHRHADPQPRASDRVRRSCPGR